MPTPDIDKGKAVLKTFRLPEQLVSSLQEEAADDGTSVNALVKSIVLQHFEWDKKASESGFTSIHKSVLEALVQGCDDETLATIGREVVPRWFQEMAEYWFQDSSPERILDTVSLRFKFSPLMRVEITKEGNSYAAVFRHDLGPKWSVLAEAAAKELARKFFHAEPQVSRGESVVTARFKVGPRKE